MKKVGKIMRPKQIFIRSFRDKIPSGRKFVLLVASHDEWLELLKAARRLWREGKLVMCITTEDGTIPEGEREAFWQNAPFYPVWRAQVDPNPGEIVLDMVLWSRFNSYHKASYIITEIEKQTGLSLWDSYVEARRRLLKEEYELWERLHEEEDLSGGEGWT